MKRKAIVTMCASRLGRSASLTVFFLLLLCRDGHGEEQFFVLGPEELASAAIVLPAEADPIKRFAAQELQHHLRLVTGTELPIVDGVDGGGKVFMIGVAPPGDDVPLETEEARYAITPKTVYLYGDDLLRHRSDDLLANIVGYPGFNFNRVGTLFAVYDFLERELGVRWLEPGEDGTLYGTRQLLRLLVGSHRWVSHFAFQRNLRSYAWDGVDVDPGYIPEPFLLTPEQARTKRIELELWLRRMRMAL